MSTAVRPAERSIIEAASLAGWRDPFPARLASRINFNAPGGCWVWTGETEYKRGGYGKLAYSTSPMIWAYVKVHRVVYEFLVGPIPPGLHLDHLCRNPPCCNPAHLEAVTPRVNIMRGRSPMIVAHHAGSCVKGHVNDFCRRPDGRVIYCRACRRERRAIKRAQEAVA